MFCSKEQIEQSITRLDRLNPFFGTVFLAFKKADLPVGGTKSIRFAQIVYDFAFLQEKAPFLAGELRRQELDNPDLPIWEDYKKV